MAFIEDCIERTIGIGTACGWFALSASPDAAASVIGQSVNLGSMIINANRGHGPESPAVLKSIRKRVTAELNAKATENGWANRNDLKEADTAMERGLAQCFLDPKELAASALSVKRFPHSGMELIFSKLAEQEPETFGESGTEAANAYAKFVIKLALEAALENEAYFKKVLPHMITEILHGLGRVEHKVDEGFSDAAQNLEKHTDKIIGHLKRGYEKPDETPDDLPEAVLIEAAKPVKLAKP